MERIPTECEGRLMVSLHAFQTAQWDQEPANDRSADRRVRVLPGSGSRGLSGPRSGGRFRERANPLACGSG